MLTFKGNRDMEDVVKIAKEKGYTVDRKAYDKGDDCIKMINDNLSIVFNTCSGWFSIYDIKKEQQIDTHMSDDLDEQEWYQDILKMLYKTE